MLSNATSLVCSVYELQGNKNDINLRTKIGVPVLERTRPSSSSIDIAVADPGGLRGFPMKPPFCWNHYLCL